MKIHNRIHTKERPCACIYNDCNKTFTTFGNRNDHIRRHEGNKRFKCDIDGC